MKKETKKYGPTERTGQNSRKRTKQNGVKQSTRLYTLIIKMLNELRGRIDDVSENINKET